MTAETELDQHDRSLIDAAWKKHAAALPNCPYCGTTEGLRVKSDGGGFEAPEFTCEVCFTPTDDGPCFDDLACV